MSAPEPVFVTHACGAAPDNSPRDLMRQARALIREGQALMVPQGGGLLIRMAAGTPPEECREVARMVAEALAWSAQVVTVTGADGLQSVGLEWAVRHQGGYTASPFTSLLAADMERMRADQECPLCGEPHKVVRRQVMDWEDASRDGDTFREAVTAAVNKQLADD
jgi:hypothetical protein